VPFPRLHFFLLAQAPLFAKDSLSAQGKDANSVSTKVKLNVQELTDQMFSSRNFLSNVKSEDGKYLTVSCGYRGSMSTSEVDDETAKIQQKMADDFVSWIPNNLKTSVINIPQEGSSMSGTFVANTTAIKGVFQRISAQFAKMYKRKAFLHWYKGEGMDEMEFQEADKNVRDLITEYQDKQDAVVDLEDGDEEEEDSAEEEEEEEEGSDEADEEEEEF